MPPRKAKEVEENNDAERLLTVTRILRSEADMSERHSTKHDIRKEEAKQNEGNVPHHRLARSSRLTTENSATGR